MNNTATDPQMGTQWQASWWWLIIATLSRGYLVFVLALAACAIAPMVAGLTGAVVLSGSMMPHIRVGDVVLVRPLSKTAPTPIGRVITFRAPAGSATTGVVMHRLVGANPDGTLITMGDANAAPDSAPLARRNIIGQAAILIPWIGLPTLWLTTGSIGLFIVWLLFTTLALVVEVLAPLGESRKRRRNPAALGSLPIHANRARAARALRSVMKPAALLLVLLAVVIAVSGSSIEQVNGSFTAQTTNVGNTWSAKAAAPAVRLVFAANPSGSTGGIPFPTQPVVAFQDASGHTTSSGGSVTLTLTNATSTFSCATNPVASVAGTSTFSGCTVNQTGTYTLTAKSGALTPATSSSFLISGGAAVNLHFLISPTATTANTTFPTAPAVTIVDAGGNTVFSAAPVTLSLTSASGATLTCGTNPQNANAGQDKFLGCRISSPGTYSLTARSPGLISGTSSSFIIGGPALPLLSCQSATWIATFSWTPRPTPRPSTPSTSTAFKCRRPALTDGTPTSSSPLTTCPRVHSPKEPRHSKSAESQRRARKS